MPAAHGERKGVAGVQERKTFHQTSYIFLNFELCGYYLLFKLRKKKKPKSIKLKKLGQENTYKMMEYRNAERKGKFTQKATSACPLGSSVPI